MPESVKDLTIRLAFEHGDTKSQVAAIRSELKLLETDFAASAAAAGGFSAGLNESQARSALLEKQIELQRQAVEKYGRAIDAEKKKLEGALSREQDYAKKLQTSKARHAELTAEKARLAAAMEAEKKANGDNTMAYLEMDAAMDKLNAEIQDCETSMKGWEKAIGNAEKSAVNAEKRIQSYTIAQNEARAAIGRMETSLAEQQRRVKAHADQLEAAEKKLRKWSDAASKAGERQEKAGKALTKASAGILYAGVTAAQAAIEWEDAFAGVRKTVSGTEQQLKDLEQALLEMETPADYTDLADIAANAGQLGIATGNVANFTKTMADLAVTTDLTAEAAASGFAQYANITRMPQENIENLGSVTVALGNNLATTESKIVDMATAIAAAGTQAGMTDQEIFGLAGGLSSLGLEAQAGGTAFSRAILKMKVAAETGNDDLEAFANVAGMSAGEFRRAFEEDAAGAFIRFVQGLSTGSESAIVMLTDMGIKEVRLRDTLLRASNANELLTKSVGMANQAWGQNTALTEEAAVRYKTTASRMKMLGKEAQRTAMSFGQSVLPYLEKGMEAISGVIEKFNGLDQAQRDNIVRWGLYAAAIGPGVSMLGKANKVIGGVSGALADFAKSLANGVGGVSSLMGALKGLLGPAGILAAVTALGIGAYKLYDWASGAKAAREATEALNKTAQSWAETQARTIYDTGTSDPLALFGLTRENFQGVSKESETWLNQLISVWTDGEKETDAIVRQFAEGFAEGSEGVREAIETQRQLLEGYDALTPEAKAQMNGDIQQLDAWDKEIAALLKKRQNGFLTEEEQARLNEIIRQRAQLEIEYKLDKGDGYQQIITQMQADVERATHGGQLDETFFGDTLNALAEGRRAYNQALDDSYRSEYASIQAIRDEEARTKALDALNARYQERRDEGLQAYNQAVLEAGKAAWQDGGYQDQLETIDKLVAQLGNVDGVDIPAVQQLAEGLDEGALTSMIALIEQLKEAGASDDDLKALGVDYAALMDKINAMRDLSANVPGLEGLNGMVGQALPEEIQRVLVGLDMTQAAEDWQRFADGESLPGIKSRLDTTTLDVSALENLTGTVTAVYQGKQVTVDLSTLDALKGTVTVYDENGNPSIVNLSELSNLVGTVTGYRQGSQLTVDLSTLDALTGTVTAYDEKGNPTTVSLYAIRNLKGTVTGYTESGEAVTVDLSTLDTLTGTVTVYDENGNPSTVALSSIKGLTGIVTGYNESGEKVVADLSTLDALTGTVTVYDENGNPSVVALSSIKNLTATVSGYIEASENVTVDLSTLDALTGTVTVYDENGNPSTVALSAIKGLTGTLTGYTESGEAVTVDLGTLDALTGTVTVYDENGNPSIVALSSLNGLTGTVSGYLEDREGVWVDLSTLDELTGTVTVYDENGHPSVVKLSAIKGLKGTVKGYQEADGVSFDAAALSQLKGEVSTISIAPGVVARASVKLNPLDAAAIAAWNRTNAKKKLQGPAAKVSVTLGDNWQDDLVKAYKDGILKVYDKDGMELPVTPEVLAKITAGDVAAVDEDGTLHVIITPDVGSQEAVDIAEAAYNEDAPLVGLPGLFGGVGDSAADTLRRANEASKAAAQARKDLEAMKSWGAEDYLVDASEAAVQDAEDNVRSVFGLIAGYDKDMEAIAAHAVNLMAALSGGELEPEAAEEYATQLKEILEFVSAADTFLGAGNEVSAGLAEGMSAYGWTGDANSLVTSLTDAVTSVLGEDAAGGLEAAGEAASASIADGMLEFGFAVACMALVDSISAGVGGLGAEGEETGRQFSFGLARGMESQMEALKQKAKAAADAIADTFRINWDEHSPSKVAERLAVFFGKGLERGMDKWPTVSDRLLQDDLSRAYGYAGRASDEAANTTNNNNNSVNLNVGELKVQDRQDAQTLAYEIANLQRRTQRARGLS